MWLPYTPKAYLAPFNRNIKCRTGRQNQPSNNSYKTAPYGLSQDFRGARSGVSNEWRQWPPTRGRRLGCMLIKSVQKWQSEGLKFSYTDRITAWHAVYSVSYRVLQTLPTLPKYGSQEAHHKQGLAAMESMSGRGEAHPIANPWVPISSSLTHMVKPLPFSSYLAGSKSVFISPTWMRRQWLY